MARLVPCPHLRALGHRALRESRLVQRRPSNAVVEKVAAMSRGRSTSSTSMPSPSGVLHRPTYTKRVVPVRPKEHHRP